ncbi:MAG: hypothetical protein ACJAWR_000531, partial [Flavobacteriales bacterium]
MKKLLITLGSIFMMMFASESAIAQCSPDVTPPNAVCQDLDLYLDGTGTAILTLAQLDGGSFDGCGAVGLSGLTQTIFTCSDIGANPGIGMTVTDGSGNTSFCSSIITVHDTIAPVAICQNITVNLDGTGNATIIGSDLDGGSTDGCGTPTLFSASITSFTCADIGPNNVWLTVTDNNGNVDSCLAIVTIADTVAPIAICQNINAYLNPFGSVTIVPSQINNGSSDVCSSVTLAISASTFTCDSLGARTVYLYTTDSSGNSDTCSSTVTVLDTTSPNVFGSNVNVHLDSNGGVRIDSSDINTTTNDNCGISTITLSQDTFSCVDAPIATITMTATDSSGNSSSADFSVFILDTIFPLVICKDTTVYLDATGNVTIDTSYTNDGSWDNCNLVLTLSQSSFNCNTLGANTVTMYGTDASNNVDSCILTVTVLDTLVPVAICQAAPTAFLDSTGNLVIDSSVINNGSNDNCNVTITLSATTFTCADIGDTLIEMYVTDASGNSDTCSTTLTIGDNIAPIVVCRDTTVYLDANGGIRIDSSYTDNGSTDNCEIKTMTLSLDTFTCANVGANIITMTVTDSAGNSSVCNSTVTVLDTVTPTIVCKDTTVYLDAAGNFIIDTSFTNNGSFDNCDFVLTLSNSSFTCTDTGANTITMTATDASGNISTCTSTVTVLDTIAPVLTTKPATVYLDSMGNVTILDSDVVLSIGEACLDTVIVTPRDFACDSIGARTVQVIAIDESGNADTMSAIVTVVDLIAPDAMCQDTTVYLDANGGFRIDSSYIENGSWDNCSIETITLSNDTFSCVNAGANVITMTVTDSSGNTSTCTATVTVLDTIAPVAVCQDTTIYLDASGNVSITPDYVMTTSGTPITTTINFDGLPASVGSANPFGPPAIPVDNYSDGFVSFPYNGTGGWEVKSGNTHNSTGSSSPNTLCWEAMFFGGGGALTQDIIFLTPVSNVSFNAGSAHSDVLTVTAYDASNAVIASSTVTLPNSVQLISFPVSGIKRIELSVFGVHGAIDDITYTVNTPVTHDNCSYTDSISKSTFTCADTGANSVTLYITDASGNIDSCTSTVTVIDNIAPTAICMDTTVYLNDSGQVIIDSSFVDGGSFDNCTYTVVLSDSIFTCADAGPNVITVILTDASGNVSSCTATVTVLDSVPPVAICKDTTIYLDASGAAIIFPIDVNDGTYDNCYSVNINTNATTFACNNVGPNAVLLIATDASGNVDTCTAIVNVLDTFGPTAICMDTTIYLDATGSFTFDSSFVDNGSYDDCSGVTMSLSDTTYTCADLGINPTTLYVTDTSGNVDSCISMVTVLDTITPVANCKDTTIYLGASGLLTIDSSFVNDSSYDNCEFTLAISQSSFTCADTGANIITLTAQDASGNSSTCTATVTILDTVPPTAICKNATIFLDSMGNASIGLSDINDGSFDNCAIDTMYLSKDTFTCADLGTNSVTLTVVDVNGNIDSCTGTVTVYDVLSPFITCKDDTLYLNGTGAGSVIAMNLVDSVWDNCSFTVTASPTIFDCNKIGVNPVR